MIFGYDANKKQNKSRLQRKKFSDHADFENCKQEFGLNDPIEKAKTLLFRA